MKEKQFQITFCWKLFMSLTLSDRFMSYFVSKMITFDGKIVEICFCFSRWDNIFLKFRFFCKTFFVNNSLMYCLFHFAGMSLISTVIPCFQKSFYLWNCVSSVGYDLTFLAFLVQLYRTTEFLYVSELVNIFKCVNWYFLEFNSNSPIIAPGTILLISSKNGYFCC
jgi:hypothetical protein